MGGMTIKVKSTWDDGFTTEAVFSGVTNKLLDYVHLAINTLYPTVGGEIYKITIERDDYNGDYSGGMDSDY